MRITNYSVHLAYSTFPFGQEKEFIRAKRETFNKYRHDSEECMNEGKKLESYLYKPLVFHLFGPFDVVFLFSVFTHILPVDMQPLLQFLVRSLTPDGQILASFFVLNETSRRGIERGTAHRQFAHAIDGAHIDNPDVPEGAVGYAEEDLRKHISDAGLAVAHWSPGKWSGQVEGAWLWQDTLTLTL